MKLTRKRAAKVSQSGSVACIVCACFQPEVYSDPLCQKISLQQQASLYCTTIKPSAKQSHFLLAQFRRIFFLKPFYTIIKLQPFFKNSAAIAFNLSYCFFSPPSSSSSPLSVVPKVMKRHTTTTTHSTTTPPLKRKRRKKKK